MLAPRPARFIAFSFVRFSISCLSVGDVEVFFLSFFFQRAEPDPAPAPAPPPPFREYVTVEERFFLPFTSSRSSSTFTLLSRPAGTLPARLLPPLGNSLSLSFPRTTLGLGTAGLSAAMLSRSSLAASVSFLLFWPRSRDDFPGLVAREVELSVSAERRADSTVSCSQMSLPWSDLTRVSISSLSLMFSRRAASSSLSILEEGGSPRAGKR